MTSHVAATARPSRLVAVLAAGGALALLAGAAMTLRGVDVSEQATRFVAVADGTLLVDADGNRTPALVGGTVPLGSTVRAAADGTVLRTGDREIVLAAGTAVAVLDGAHQRLEEGALLVDALDARGLQITSGAADVEVPDEAVVRVERAPVLRVATYAGTAEVRAPGRRTGREVPRLQQVQVPDGALPGRPLPLVLTLADDWEAERLPQVVLEDTALRSLASTLSGAASASAARVREDLATVVPALAVAATPVESGERSVAHALAHVDGVYSAEAFDAVRKLRGLGGSWGVVAALSGTSLADAEAYLEGLLPSAVQALGPGSGSAGDLSGVLGVPGLGGPGGAPGTDPRRPGAGPSPVEVPAPVDAPAPAPRPTPGGTGGGLQAILDSVLDLLPLPVAATTPAAPVVAPTQVPASAPSAVAPASPAPAARPSASPAAPAPAPVELPAPLPVLPLPPVKAPTVKLPLQGSATGTVGTSALLVVPAPLR